MAHYSDYEIITTEEALTGRRPATPPPSLSEERAVPLDWEKTFRTWNKIGSQYRLDPPPGRPLIPEDEAFLNGHGISFTRRIGSGGYSVVWEVTVSGLKKDEPGNDADCVMACKIMELKTFKRDHDYSPIRDPLERFLQEVNIMKRLARNHKHIIRDEKVVRIYDRVSQFPFPIRICIFMEKCEQSLDELADQYGTSGMGERLAMPWFAQIASALQYLHGIRIAHLDVKPDNILISRNPLDANEVMAKLTDYGLAQEIGPNDTRSTFFVGTRLYKVPEITAMRPFDPFLADVYSFGVTLADCLAGREPKSARLSMPVDSRRVSALLRGVAADPSTVQQTFHGLTQDAIGLLASMTRQEPSSRANMKQVYDHPLVAAYHRYVNEHFRI